VTDHLEDLQALYSGRYWAHLGVEFVEAVGGRALCRVRLREQHMNYNSVVHGGVISGLVDSAAGAAVRTCREPREMRERPHATSDLHVQYLAAATGSELLARARVLKVGRTAVFAEVDVEDDSGRLVARGSVTFVVSASHARRSREDEPA